MEKDIVDRMLDWLYEQPHRSGTELDPWHPEVLISQAVDEIEKLRGALDYYAERRPSPYAGTGPYDPATHDPGSVARAALGEEK
jgi:hypothetical protein